MRDAQQLALLAVDVLARIARAGRRGERVVVVPRVQLRGWRVRGAVYHLCKPAAVVVTVGAVVRGHPGDDDQRALALTVGIIAVGSAIGPRACSDFADRCQSITSLNYDSVQRVYYDTWIVVYCSQQV